MDYKAITSESFYFQEMRDVSRFLIDKDKPIEEYKEEIKELDLLNTKSNSNFQKKFLSMKRRIPTLSKNLLLFLINEDSSIAKFINLYSVAVSERLIFEFFSDVIKSKVDSYDRYLSDLDFEKFMQLKSEQSQTVDSWSEASKKKVSARIKRFLIEGGYLYKDGEVFRIAKPIIPIEIIDEIKINGNKKLIKAMLF